MNNREAEPFEVDANLVGATGNGAALHQGNVALRIVA